MTNREALDLYHSVRYNLTHPRHKEAVDVAFAVLVKSGTDINVGSKTNTGQSNCFQKCNSWTSVKDRLPKPDTDVLIWLEDIHGIAVGQLNFRGELSDFWTRHFNPTHWMPLPEPPKEEV